MGMKGKLIASIEVKCGGFPIYDILHTKTHHVPIMTNVVNHFEIHEGEIVKNDSIISWNYNEAGQKKIVKKVIEAIDPNKKLIRWKIIEGDLLERYSSFTVVTSCEHQWTTWTIEYERKTEDTPEPLIELGLLLDITKDIEGHHLKS